MRTVFLDRDGVINRKLPEDHYVSAWTEFEFLPGVPEALRLLKSRRFRLIVVTNQRGISLGRLRETDLRALHEKMQSELGRAGAAVDAIYYCPHAENSCQCRKPGIGMFLQAQRDFPDIEFADCIVIGDSPSDVEAGARLGCRTILLAPFSHAGEETTATGHARPDWLAGSLLEAAERCVAS